MTNEICFTTDLDWASEREIEEMLNFFFSNQIPLTIFLTHESKIVRDYYDNPLSRNHVGLHFNFCLEEIGCKTYQEIVLEGIDLWNSCYYSNHRFFDSTTIQLITKRLGFIFDRNICLFLRIAHPFILCSGLIRYPVFWEDDVHKMHDLPLDFKVLLPQFDEQGLKILNIHPQHFKKEISILKDIIDRYDSFSYLYDIHQKLYMHEKTHQESNG